MHRLKRGKDKIKAKENERERERKIHDIHEHALIMSKNS